MKKLPLFLGFSTVMAVFVTTVLMEIPLVTHADTGPKQTTTITLEGMEGVDTYYVAPLGIENDGPGILITGIGDFAERGITPTAIDERFLEFNDLDGYDYTIYRYAICSGNDEVTWSYYPPDPFKVLLLIPESDAFVVTEIMHRTTFDSFFTLSLDGQEYRNLSADDVIVLDPSIILNSYDLGDVVLGFLGRMVLTLVLELGLAWLFKYRSKKQFLTILIANVVTQVVINLAFNLIYLFFGGGLTYWLVFSFLELGVFVAESLFYKLFFTHKAKTNPKDYVARYAILYAFLANLLSMGVGILFSFFWDFTHF